MAYSVEEFCRDCSHSLQSSPGTVGRDEVRVHLERLLANQDFINSHLGSGAENGRHLLYQDVPTGFCLLAHVNDAPYASPPHDHGASWAIYGQAAAYTDMTEYRRVDGGAGAGDAEIEEVRRYRLERGHAAIYDVGAIHAIDYPAGARFVRVTGTDLETVPRLKFDTAAKRAEVIDSTWAGRG